MRRILSNYFCTILMCVALTACLPGKKQEEKVISKAVEANKTVEVEKMAANMGNAALILMAGSIPPSSGNLQTVDCRDGNGNGKVLAYIRKSSSDNKGLNAAMASRLGDELKSNFSPESVKEASKVTGCASFDVSNVALNSPVLILESFANKAVVTTETKVPSFSVSVCRDATGKQIPGVIITRKNPDGTTSELGKCDTTIIEGDVDLGVGTTNMPNWKERLTGADSAAVVPFKCIEREGDSTCTDVNDLDEREIYKCDTGQEPVEKYVINPVFRNGEFVSNPYPAQGNCGHGWTGQLVSRVKSQTCSIILNGNQLNKKPATLYEIAHIAAKCARSDLVNMETSCPVGSENMAGRFYGDLSTATMKVPVALEPIDTGTGKMVSPIALPGYQVNEKDLNGVKRTLNASSLYVPKDSSLRSFKSAGSSMESTKAVQDAFAKALIKDMGDNIEGGQITGCNMVGNTCISGTKSDHMVLILDRSASMGGVDAASMVNISPAIANVYQCKAGLKNIFKAEQSSMACDLVKTYQKGTQGANSANLKVADFIKAPWANSGSSQGYGPSGDRLNLYTQIEDQLIDKIRYTPYLQYALATGWDCGGKSVAGSDRKEPFPVDMFGVCASGESCSTCPGQCVEEQILTIPDNLKVRRIDQATAVLEKIGRMPLKPGMRITVGTFINDVPSVQSTVYCPADRRVNGQCDIARERDNILSMLVRKENTETYVKPVVQEVVMPADKPSNDGSEQVCKTETINETIPAGAWQAASTAGGSAGRISRQPIDLTDYEMKDCAVLSVDSAGLNGTGRPNSSCDAECEAQLRANFGSTTTAIGPWVKFNWTDAYARRHEFPSNESPNWYRMNGNNEVYFLCKYSRLREKTVPKTVTNCTSASATCVPASGSNTSSTPATTPDSPWQGANNARADGTFYDTNYSGPNSGSPGTIDVNKGVLEYPNETYRFQDCDDVKPLQLTRVYCSSEPDKRQYYRDGMGNPMPANNSDYYEINSGSGERRMYADFHFYNIFRARGIYSGPMNLRAVSISKTTSPGDKSYTNPNGCETLTTETSLHMIATDLAATEGLSWRMPDPNTSQQGYYDRGFNTQRFCAMRQKIGGKLPTCAPKQCDVSKCLALVGAPSTDNPGTGGPGGPGTGGPAETCETRPGQLEEPQGYPWEDWTLANASDGHYMVQDYDYQSCRSFTGCYSGNWEACQQENVGWTTSDLQPVDPMAPYNGYKGTSCFQRKKKGTHIPTPQSVTLCHSSEPRPNCQTASGPFTTRSSTTTLSMEDQREEGYQYKSCVRMDRLAKDPNGGYSYGYAENYFKQAFFTAFKARVNVSMDTVGDGSYYRLLSVQSTDGQNMPWVYESNEGDVTLCIERRQASSCSGTSTSGGSGGGGQNCSMKNVADYITMEAFGPPGGQTGGTNQFGFRIRSTKPLPEDVQMEIRARYTDKNNQQRTLNGGVNLPAGQTLHETSMMITDASPGVGDGEIMAEIVRINSSQQQEICEGGSTGAGGSSGVNNAGLAACLDSTGCAPTKSDLQSVQACYTATNLFNGQTSTHCETEQLARKLNYASGDYKGETVTAHLNHYVRAKQGEPGAILAPVGVMVEGVDYGGMTPLSETIDMVMSHPDVSADMNSQKRIKFIILTDGIPTDVTKEMPAKDLLCGSNAQSLLSRIRNNSQASAVFISTNDNGEANETCRISTNDMFIGEGTDMASDIEKKVTFSGSGLENDLSAAREFCITNYGANIKIYEAAVPAGATGTPTGVNICRAFEIQN